MEPSPFSDWSQSTDADPRRIVSVAADSTETKVAPGQPAFDSFSLDSNSAVLNAPRNLLPRDKLYIDSLCENPEAWFGSSLDSSHSLGTSTSVSKDNHSPSASDTPSLEVGGDEQDAFNAFHTSSRSSSHYEPTPPGGQSLSLPEPLDPLQSSRHVWVTNGEVTPSRDLAHHIHEVCYEGVRTFFCHWAGCKHPVGFAQKSQLITHIRSVHLQEKPFLCTTCNTSFARKQEANRHVESMNRGKRYKCSACSRAFSRKHYRDTHEERCLSYGQARWKISNLATDPAQSSSQSQNHEGSL